MDGKAVSDDPQRQRDEKFMSMALELAARGRYTARPNPCVGCVLVRGGQVVGRGWHIRAGEAHAEVRALSDAGDLAREATCYVTLEPCTHFGRTPPCVESLIQAQVSRVVIASEDPNPDAGGGIKRLAAAGIEVVTGVLSDQAHALNRGFFESFRLKRPYVRLKVGMSIDGRTAMSDGESQWITGEAARQDVQLLRAMSGAIITGSGTVLADDPLLTVRQSDWPKAWPYPIENPIRVVCDSQCRVSADARIFSGSGQQWRAHAQKKQQKQQKHQAGIDDDVSQYYLPGMGGQVDLSALLVVLHRESVRDVLVEAGAGLNGAFLRSGLVDELWIYVGAKVLGGRGLGVFDDAGIAVLADAPHFALYDVKRAGQDCRLIYRRPAPEALSTALQGAFHFTSDRLH